MQTTQERLDEAARYAQDGIDSTQRRAHRTLDRLTERAADWRDEAAPVVDRLARRAGTLARDGASWVQDGTERVRSQVARASDRTVGYVRDEPVRSVLMAAAAGALIYALVRMMAGQRSER